MRKGSKDLSLEERQAIHKMKSAGVGIRKIGRDLCRSASTISREVRRVPENRYLAGKLQWYETAKLIHDDSRKRRGKKRKRFVELKNPTVQSYVYNCLKQGWSPGIIAIRIKIDLPGESVSPETIYQYIYGHDRTLVQYLVRKGNTRRHSGKNKSRPLRGKRRKRDKGKEAKRPIGIRPQAANDRSEIGHLETDLIVSPPKKGKSALQVTVDRSNRKVILSLVDSREANEARRKLLQKLIILDPCERKTLTADNGSEHADLPLLETVLPDFLTFYCGPYRSWERGTVEAINGILRRAFPKGTIFDNITAEEVKRVEDWFNNRPMIVLNGKTPNEVHAAQLADLLALSNNSDTS